MKHLMLQQLLVLKEPTKGEGEVVVVVGVVGKWHGHDMGSFEITQSDLETMVQNFNNQETDIVVDYEHQTLYGSVAPAAGWISKLEVKENQLLATVSWTPKAKEHISNSEYKYLSPVYAFNSRDPKTDAYIGLKLHSVALTNTPFIDDLGEVKANKETQTKNEEKDPMADEATKTQKEETLEAENIALKEQLATQKVEAAIAAKKIAPEQKEWALTYCKENMEGFDAFIATQKEQKQVPPNNLYPNKQTSHQEEQEPDVVAMALNK